jgi:hypothetical protein
MLPAVKSEKEARAVISAGLGRAELELATSFTAPLYWIIRETDGKYRVRNGSAFFLDAGAGPFGVTANHVIDGWRQDRAHGNVVALQLGLDLQLDLEEEHAIIAAHQGLDLATFRITANEIKRIGKQTLTGYQKSWPPGPPEQGRGIYYSGFPATETIWLSPRAISFGAAAGGGVASSVSDTDVSMLIEQQSLIGVIGGGSLPENYDFRGISGGPVLTVVETSTIRSWALAGVIYEGPNPSADDAQAIAGLEIIRARRAHFILPDGQLDIRRWVDIAPR